MGPGRIMESGFYLGEPGYLFPPGLSNVPLRVCFPPPPPPPHKKRKKKDFNVISAEAVKETLHL